MDRTFDVRDRVERTLQGDDDAFTELVRLYQDMVYALAFQRIRNALDAEDIAQETFTRAYRNLVRLRKPETFGSWLCGIALNVVREYFRARKPTVPLSAVAEPAAAEPPEPGDEARRVLELVGRLPTRYRVPVTLFYIRGTHYADIAALLGLRESTVRSRVHRARAMIRRQLGRTGRSA